MWKKILRTSRVHFILFIRINLNGLFWCEQTALNECVFLSIILLLLTYLTYFCPSANYFYIFFQTRWITIFFSIDFSQSFLHVSALILGLHQTASEILSVPMSIHKKNQQISIYFWVCLCVGIILVHPFVAYK